MATTTPPAPKPIPQQQVFGPAGGQIPSGVAGIRVEMDVAAFNVSMNRYLNLMQEDVVKVVSNQALTLLGKIQPRTPVDTGRLRRSFHAVLPGQTDGSFPYTDNAGKAFDGALNVSPQNGGPSGQVEAVVGTNVYYALIIEAGHSRQAPSGMVAISVAEQAGELDTACSAAILAAWIKAARP